MPPKRRKYQFGEKLKEGSHWVFIQDEDDVVYPDGKRARKALFKCSCGHTESIFINSVRNGSTEHCGCLSKLGLTRGERSITHGVSRTREYQAWYSMVERCHKETHHAYEYYGGRGISVCERWQGAEGLFNFIKDMGPFSKGDTLDRIDTNDDYKPNNCRKVDRSVQSFNRRPFKETSSGVTGVCKSKTEGKWEARIKKDRVNYHLGTFSNLDDAIKARKEAEIRYYGFELDYT